MKRSEAVYLRGVIEQAVQSLGDETALTAKRLYPTFDSLIGQTVAQGFKFTYGDKLYTTAQGVTFQSHYPPGDGTESLYTEVCESHAGTLDDPIPYSGNMALVSGLHYVQDNVIYLCNRDTGTAVYNALSELVGLYVEVVA